MAGYYTSTSNTTIDGTTVAASIEISKHDNEWFGVITLDGWTEEIYVDPERTKWQVTAEIEAMLALGFHHVPSLGICLNR